MLQEQWTSKTVTNISEEDRLNLEKSHNILNLNDLPYELLLKIVTLLPEEDRLNAEKSCKILRNVCCDPRFYGDIRHTPHREWATPHPKSHDDMVLEEYINENLHRIYQLDCHFLNDLTSHSNETILKIPNLRQFTVTDRMLWSSLDLESIFGKVTCLNIRNLYQEPEESPFIHSFGIPRFMRNIKHVLIESVHTLIIHPKQYYWIEGPSTTYTFPNLRRLEAKPYSRDPFEIPEYWYHVEYLKLTNFTLQNDSLFKLSSTNIHTVELIDCCLEEPYNDEVEIEPEMNLKIDNVRVICQFESYWDKCVRRDRERKKK